MYKVDEETLIRKLEKGDEKKLLDFYLSFSDRDKFFFQPWPFTLEAMKSNVKEAVKNKTISLIAVDNNQNIIGHTFIQNIKSSREPKIPPISGLINLRKIPKHIYDFVDWSVIFLLKIPSKPWFGIGLHQNARGKGLGKILMHLVFEEAKRLNVPLVTLAVHHTNEKAINLYQKWGFNIIDKNKKARNLREKIGFTILNKILRKDKKDFIEMETLLNSRS